MKRVEIIANSALAEDVTEGLEHLGDGMYYTRINNVHGLGSSGPRRGDHIWPEENIIFIVYCEEEDARALETHIIHLKEQFPDEGLKIFIM